MKRKERIGRERTGLIEEIAKRTDSSRGEAQRYVYVLEVIEQA